MRNVILDPYIMAFCPLRPKSHVKKLKVGDDGCE